MPKENLHAFVADLMIIGVNPYVSVPEPILAAIFEAAGKDKGPIPICGEVNGKPYRQTLVRYAGEWRLYINMVMLPDSPRRVGERLSVTIAFDPADRSLTPHPQLLAAISADPAAQAAWDSLTPSRRLEIVRYIGNLKQPESVQRNVERAVQLLLGKGRFVGRGEG